MPSVDEQIKPWVAFVEQYRDDPVGLVQDLFGVTPDPPQCAIMEDCARGERRITVRSGHGVGKTTVAAWICIWFLLTRFPVKVVITAPTSSQLYDAMYAEIKRWFRMMPADLAEMFEIKSERIELRAAPAESFLSVRTSRAEAPDALQGVHSKNVLLIGDEASGIPEQVFEAAGGSMSGHSAITLLLGNPVRSSGFFYDTHTNPALTGWKRHHISCLDSPRVSPEFIQEMREKYGEDSSQFRVRVLGEWPKSDDDTVIPMELINLATVRDVTCLPSSSVVWALDVARFGGDRSALVKRKANVVPERPMTWRNLDLMQLCGAVFAEWDSTPMADRPEEILVDAIGLGSGVADRLRELGLPVRAINVSEAPSMGAKYVNLRAELWFAAREWLAKRDCSIPDDESLVGELAMVRYSYMSNGKLQIESKDQIRKRGRASPDVADAFVLTFAGNAATAMHGWSPASEWNKPLKRGLGGIV
jgi:hypothetical protein